VIGDVIELMGHTHQFLPPQVHRCATTLPARDEAGRPVGRCGCDRTQ